MRHVSPKISFLSPSPQSRPPLFLLFLQVSHFSSSSSSFSPSSLSHSHSFSRRQEEESRNVKVSVWWDFENCNVPSGINYFRIAHTITAAIRANGMKGPIEITAFGDMLQLSRSKQEALSSTGINLNHVPGGGKNSADRCLLLNLMFWVSQNPPPAHLFLISGDKDFACILHRLRMSNYNILLAGPEYTHGALSSAASIMWYWHDLLCGKNLTGKYFNQPPDGPYGSWYGHYKLPLLDPFSEIEQPEESSDSDDCTRPVPRAIIKDIRQILKSHPKGLLMSELRNKLTNNHKFDKDYYGYKRFLPLLLAQEHILKVKQGGDGQLTVHAVDQKFPKAFEGNQGMSSGPESYNEDEDVNEHCVKEDADNRSYVQKSPEKLSTSPSTSQNVKDILEKAHQPSPFDGNVIKAVNAPEVDSSLPPRDEKIVETVNLPEPDGHVPPRDEKIVEMPNAPEKDSTDDAGFFRKMWRKWFRSKSGDFDDKSCKDQEKYSTYAGGSEKKSDTASVEHFASRSKDGSATGTDEEKDSKSLVGFVDLEQSLSFNESVLDRGTSTSPGLVDRIRNWSKFWKSTSDSEKQSDYSSDRPNMIITDSGKDELFTKVSFWNNMKSFMETPKGLLLVSESKTREQMAHNLQRKGPKCLQSLRENDLLHLVDLLISEKKWVEERPFEVFPFKLTRFGKSLSSDHSNALSAIFSGRSQSNSERLPKHDGEGESGNVSCVESSHNKRKLPMKSENEILADCQMLVNEMLKEHSKGFFIGSFRKHFLEKYRYHLSPQKLGFENLSSLLGAMSGVKVESGHLIPSNNTTNTESSQTSVPNKQENTSHMVDSVVELSNESKKGDDVDSLFEELGPVVSMKSRKVKPGSASRKIVAKLEENQSNFDYEPAVSEDEFSDSGETFPASGAEGHGKGNAEKETNSLLLILDKWYSEGRDNRKDKPENADGVSDLVTEKAKLSDSFVVGAKRETSLKSQGRKHRPQKTYCFVTDQDSNESSEKLVDGLLEKLRKPKAICE